MNPEPPRRSWLDIPGLAGLLGGVAFLLVTVGGYVALRLIFWGYVEW